MKYKILLVTLMLATLVLASCQTTTQDTQTTGGPAVVATFYPLYDFTTNIVKGHATVTSLVPAGVEPHSFEPSPGDVLNLNEADVFVTLGVEFEEFEEDLVEAVNPSVTVVPAAQGIRLLELEEGHDHGHEDEADHSDEHEEETDHHDEEAEGHHDEEEMAHEDEHHHEGVDPHIWLSPRNAQRMVQNIANGLMAADPQNSDVYMQNSQAFIQELQALDQEFSAGLSSCAKDVILVNHNAFSYLGADYGFETIEIAGLEPEAEPTPQQLATLIEEAQEHDLKYIFYEELVDSRVAQTIAAEVGARVLPLSPVASDLTVPYTQLMRQNLENLKTALECN